MHAYLYFDDREGLSFLWFSELQELEKNEKGKLEPEDESDLRKTTISSFCDEIFYCYYGDEDDKEGDIKEWKVEDDLEENIQSGKFRIPAFIKLVFRWAEEDLERTVTLAVERIAPNGLEEDSFEKRKKKSEERINSYFCSRAYCSYFSNRHSFDARDDSRNAVCKPAAFS